MKNSVWSEEKSLRALRLWADGLTASEIAEALGQDVSRNSVLAHFWRLRRMFGSVHAPASRKRVKKIRPERKLRRIALADLPEPDFVGPLNALPDEGTCRFIRGELRGEWRACGQAAMPNSSWCAHHHARVYLPVKRSGYFYYQTLNITGASADSEDERAAQQARG